MTIHTKQYRDNHCVNSSRNLSEEKRMSVQSTWNIKKSLAVILAAAPLVLAGCGAAAVGAEVHLRHHHLHPRHLQHRRIR